jgi:haloalkane dehalogenase
MSFAPNSDQTTSMTASPFAAARYRGVRGQRMAYLDEGTGRSLVFQHGNPTSSYLWRNVMRGCAGLGRLVACDLIGMGGSDKLAGTGDPRYAWDVHYDYLSRLWAELDLGDGIVLVLHDWGSSLGFQWAMDHPERVAGIVYMEAIVMPLTWGDWPEDGRNIFQGFRSPAGEKLVLEKNLFIEGVLPASVIRPLEAAELDAYRAPFAAGGEDRRAMLAWPRQLPIAGEPAAVVDRVARYGEFLRTSPIPKLFINTEPGSILVGRARDYCRSWASQREVTVAGKHFVQEDSPGEIAAAIRQFVAEIGGS